MDFLSLSSIQDFSAGDPPPTSVRLTEPSSGASERFKDVYQIQLATDSQDKNLAFLISRLSPTEDFDCTGMIYAPDKK